MKGNKVSLLLLVVPALLFLSGCGGGSSGSGYIPAGTHSGQPEFIQLLPNLFVAQVNGCITLNAQVRDGTGVPLANIPVVFTNQSAPFAKTYDSCAAATRTAVTSAITDANGVATVVLSSTVSGFATILAEMNVGGFVTDQKTVFFTSGVTSTFTPTLALDVAGSDGIFGEQSAYTLFTTPNDNTREVRATVTNGILLVSGIEVTFAADQPYKLGTDPTTKCSDGSSTCAVTFPDAAVTGDVKTTDSNGQAFTTVVVTPTALSSIQTVLNITAQAANGAFNMVSLFLEPVEVATITVFANPQTVAAGGTSAISADVTTTAGTPVPDGTTVTFTTTGGDGIVTIGQTAGGIATSTFTASTAATPVTVTAATGGVHGSTIITVTPAPTPSPTPAPTPAPLSVSPVSNAATITCTAGGSQVFTVTGGTAPYTISPSGNIGVTITGSPVLASGGSFLVTTPAGSCGDFNLGPNIFNIKVTDKASAVFNVFYTVTDP